MIFSWSGVICHILIIYLTILSFRDLLLEYQFVQIIVLSIFRDLDIHEDSPETLAIQLAFYKCRNFLIKPFIIFSIHFLNFVGICHYFSIQRYWISNSILK